MSQNAKCKAQLLNASNTKMIRTPKSEIEGPDICTSNESNKKKRIIILLHYQQVVSDRFQNTNHETDKLKGLKESSIKILTTKY